MKELGVTHPHPVRKKFFSFTVVAYKSIDSFDPLLQLHKPN